MKKRMMGRACERRATSTKPAARNAEAMPVKAKAGGVSAPLGSTG
jgi:hypothetical protein